MFTYSPKLVSLSADQIRSVPVASEMGDFRH